ncbi:TatD family hydrolase [Streptomyces sp. NPDC058375]|uniref:TatD family hydrolase n=1 Tax=Streptomyces sp. NPDC058375 TaxID=3346467 RepID=UPI003661DEDC
MRIFDPHIHMTSRTTDDYRAMYDAGVQALVEPAFWLGRPRTLPASFADYFDGLLGWESYRSAQFGIKYHCALGLNPKETNDPRCTPVLDLLPRYLVKDGVVAVGEVGYDTMTEAENQAFAAQLALAVEFGLSALVHTPHREKGGGTERSLAVIAESGIAPGFVVLDHLNEVTVVDSSCWMGFFIYPDRKMTPERMVSILQRYGTERMLVNSTADWGHSAPLLTRITAETMPSAGFDEDDLDRVMWRNPPTFDRQSGRLDLDDYNDVQAAGLYGGNPIARGSG